MAVYGDAMMNVMLLMDHSSPRGLLGQVSIEAYRMYFSTFAQVYFLFLSNSPGTGEADHPVLLRNKMLKLIIYILILSVIPG